MLIDCVAQYDTRAIAENSISFFTPTAASSSLSSTLTWPILRVITPCEFGIPVTLISLLVRFKCVGMPSETSRGPEY